MENLDEIKMCNSSSSRELLKDTSKSPTSKLQKSKNCLSTLQFSGISQPIDHEHTVHATAEEQVLEAVTRNKRIKHLEE